MVVMFIVRYGIKAVIIKNDYRDNMIGVIRAT